MVNANRHIVEISLDDDDDVLGDEVPLNQQQSLRQTCYRLLKLDTVEGIARANGGLQFPGPRPLSLNRENLQLLRQSYCRTTLKIDGTRYMMLMTPDACYLIDERFKFRKVQMRFPCIKTNKVIAGKTHQYTLLDGEMTIYDTDSKGKQKRIYLIYDLMALNGKSVIELPFNQRWEMIHKEVIEPRRMEMCAKRIDCCDAYEMESFQVRRKDFWMLKAASKLSKIFTPEYHLLQTAGLIFQGWNDPYRSYTNECLLEWKYPQIKSVDFLVESGADNLPQFFLLERGMKKRMGGNMVVFKDAFDPLYLGKVIECSWDPKDKVWKCMQIRECKSLPSEFKTYQKVKRSIDNDINEDFLFNQISEIVCLPMYAHRDSKVHQQAQHATTQVMVESLC